MTWNDITLDKFNDIKEFLLDPKYTEEDKLLYEISILFNIPDPSKLKIPEINYYIQQLKFLDEKIPTMKLKDHYDLGGTRYVLMKELKDITVAQWLDWQNLLKNGGDSDNYKNLLSVFLIPEGKPEYGEEYDIGKVREDIGKFMSIPDCVSLAAFFLDSQRAFVVNSLLYTIRQTKRLPIPKVKKREMKKALWKSIKEVILGV